MAQQLDNAENERAILNTPKANLQTLTKRQDFILASRGLKHSCETMIVQINKNDLALIRVGFTCSKKIGNAVKRNKAKRIMRELARKIIINGKINSYYVLIAKSSLLDEKFSNLLIELKEKIND